MDRFDLEQSILQCWNVCDDIDLLYENVMEKDMSVDDIANALLGMKTLYQMKFDKCFNCFETLVSNKDIK
jgi:hypothetical protein